MLTIIQNFSRCRLALAAVFSLSLAVSGFAQAQPTQSKSTVGQAQVTEIASGLQHPWGLAVFPTTGNSGGLTLLVTERAGRMRIVDAEGRLSSPLSGVPAVHASGQGGLLDVVAAPDFATSRRIYFSFAQPSPEGARTAVASARVSDDLKALENVKVIWGQVNRFPGGHHFGSRIAIARDGTLFITMGDRYSEKDKAQDLTTHFGKIVRINPDGSMPNDNPFVKGTTANGQRALSDIWSYGHRNAQGAAINPTSGKLWINEHGPRGGDEINVPQAGKNYGWPVIGYGIDYSGLRLHEANARAGMEPPIHYWVPSIAPSGMAFYTADRFPQWKNSLFIGALAGKHLARLTIGGNNGEQIVGEERLLSDRNERIRDVRQGPDGYLYVITDESNGKVLRVAPQ